MLATKPVAAYQKEASDKTLKRALGIPSLIAFGIGGIIGTGIFVLTGLAAAQHAGPAIALSFVIAGIGCMFAGLCYSEFAAMVPVAGSAYAYSYATLGEFVAWFVGWNLILEYMMACSTVAVGWSRYFVKLLEHYGINFIPSSLSSAPFEAAEVGFQIHTTGAVLNLPAIAVIVAATALCYKGIKESAVVNTIIVAIKVSIVIAVIVFGAMYVDTKNWVPYIPKNTGTFGEFGWSGILQAAAIIFFCGHRVSTASTGRCAEVVPASAALALLIRNGGRPGLYYAVHPVEQQGYRRLGVRQLAVASSASASSPAVDYWSIWAFSWLLRDSHDDHPAGPHLVDDVA